MTSHGAARRFTRHRWCHAAPHGATRRPPLCAVRRRRTAAHTAAGTRHIAPHAYQAGPCLGTGLHTARSATWRCTASHGGAHGGLRTAHSAIRRHTAPHGVSHGATRRGV
eukprot:gene12975-biopygen2763